MKVKNILSSAEDYILIDKQELQEDDTLEIIFSKPNGKALWKRKEPVNINGKIIVNGYLETNTPSDGSVKIFV